MTDPTIAATRNALLEYGASIDPMELFPTEVPQAATLVFEDPFAFAMATSLDRGTKAEIIWTVPYDLKRALGHLDPRRLAIMPEPDLGKVVASLPRKPRYTRDAPRTIRELSTLVVDRFGGDAARIWQGRSARAIKSTFESIHGVGPGIASMAVLLLEKGCGLRFDDLDHRNMDIKPDVHTTRVLYRLGAGRSESESDAVRAARMLSPDYPGAIDAPLWKLGKVWCRPGIANCGECPVRAVCTRVGVA